MLDNYFKSYFWTFRLLVLALAAFIVAQTVNAFVGRAIAVPPGDIAAPRSSAKSRATGPKQDLTEAWSEFLDRNVFKAEREDLTPPPAAADLAAAEAESMDIDPEDLSVDKCEKSALATTLVATLVSTDPGESVAVFQDPKEKEVVSLRVSDKIQDKAEILYIENRNVFVRNNNRCERFSLEEQKAVAARPQPPRPRKKRKGGKNDLGKGIEKTGDGEYTIPKPEIDNILTNMNKLATQARIVPSFRNGKANGFKLFSIRPNSLYAKIGIQNGDIIQKINGYEINSPDKALAIYSKLKDASNVSVDLLRRGKKKTLSYSIR